MNTKHYFLYRNEQQQGPYTISQMRGMWQSGAITLNDQYWQEGFDEWQPISSLLDLLGKR